MCGRYGLFAEPEELAAQFGFDPAAFGAGYRPRWNIAPAGAALVVEADGGGGRTAEMLRWGLATARGPGRLLFNARAETITERPAFREAFARRRCLFPANGFYEWASGPAGSKTPVWVHPAAGGLVAFAGIRWDEAGAIITGAANRLTAPVHHRMPVILPPELWDEWLGGESAPDTLRAMLACREWPDMRMRAVSGLVNRADNEGPQLIEPVTGDDGDGQVVAPRLL